MSDSEDSYGGYDLSEFTAEDFARIDAAISNTPLSPITLPPNGGPKLSITLEPSLPDCSVEAGSSSNDTITPIHQTVIISENSPLHLYRRKGVLSVTDLVSPAWCELQFDYGLRQKRFLKPQHRPRSFLSGSGKEIVVQQAIAQENFQVQKKGHSVHKALEREVKPEAIPIRIRTDEERWALRLVNMMACFESLKLLGLAREIPIFGIVDGQVVIGIIDELTRQPVTEEGSTSTKRNSDYGQETPRKRRHKTPSDEAQTSETLTPVLSILDMVQQSSDPPTSPKGKGKALPRTVQTPLYMLHVLDTKTRRTNSMPSHADTISSRLQVMLYHRLLNNILATPSGMFDFEELWNKLDLDPSKPFSDEFLVQAGLIADFDDESVVQPPANCLDKLVHCWYQTVVGLDVIGVSPLLELVYRKQPQNRKGKGRDRKSAEITFTVSKEDAADQEEEKNIAAAILASISESNVGDDHLILAIQASLESYGREQNDVTGDGPSTIDASASMQSSSVVHAAEVVPAVATGSMATVPRVGSPSLAGASPSVDPALATPFSTAIQRENTLPVIAEGLDDNLTDATNSKGFIIGTKKFLMDDKLLDEYIRGVLQWWRGHREAQGVAETEVKRCNSCEYCNGCEWREAKATEIQTKIQFQRVTS